MVRRASSRPSGAVVVAGCLLGAAGCRTDWGSWDDPTPIDAPVPDTAIICDCWDSTSCHDGVIHVFGPGPCVNDVCPGYQHVCPRGCDVEGASFWNEYFGPKAALCAGTPDAEPGDPCGESWCLPTHAIDQGDGTVVQTYLACGSGGRCVIAEPPVVDGWLEPCAGVTAPPGFSGVVGISWGLCLVVHDAERACVVTARTIPCRGDWECPQGASCDDALPTPGNYRTPACRPGPRGAPLPLPCAP